jgi:hypothetical protein
MVWKILSRGACAAAVTCFLASCGGADTSASSSAGSSGAPASGGSGTNGGTQTVQGIAMPSSVSVVTATNASN